MSSSIPDAQLIEEAIARGRRVITKPSLAIFLIGHIGLPPLVIFLHFPFWLWPLALLLFFVLAWLWWSIKSTCWKVWAFSRVRNVHELRKRAIAERLIFREGHFLNRTEIWRDADRLAWAALQPRFAIPDDPHVEDDPKVLPETPIYFSKFKKYRYLFFGLVACAFGLLAVFIVNFSVVGVPSLVIGAYIAYSEGKDALNHSPQITISNAGIQITGFRFHNWPSITDEGVQLAFSRRGRHHYLEYRVDGRLLRWPINELDAEPEQVRHLLRVYRSRGLSRP